MTRWTMILKSLDTSALDVVTYSQLRLIVTDVVAFVWNQLLNNQELKKMIPAIYTEVEKEFNKADKALNPLLVYWPAKNKYFVSYHFSKEHIAKRGMEVVRG